MSVEPMLRGDRGFTAEPNQRSFMMMNFQERVEALTNGANNSFAKIAIVLSMKDTRPYTSIELYNAIAECLNRSSEDLPFSVPLPSNLCLLSLAPIGAVVKGKIKRKGTAPVAFVKTSDAERFALPIAAKLLTLANELDISLVELCGRTITTGDTCRGFGIALVLEALRDGKVHSAIDISRKTELVDYSIPHTLNSLKSLVL